VKELCRCLIEKRIQAERRGIVDFGARLLAQRSEAGSEGSAGGRASLSVRIDAGPAYRVRRIDFQGNRHLSDLTLRRSLLLSEGENFDRARLQRSLTRLNLTGLVHPVSNVEVRRDSIQKAVDLTISVRERDKGGWLLRAPVWVRLARDFRLSAGSRLPSWGPSYLELSTHFVTLSLASPLAGLPLSVLDPTRLSIGLERPYLPGQAWRSGFQVCPQRSWRHALFASSLLQLRPRLRERLQEYPDLHVPLYWSTASSDATRRPASGVLVCRPARKPRRFVSSLQSAAEWLLALE